MKLIAVLLVALAVGVSKKLGKKEALLWTE